jgi:hypothetical protein
LAPWEVSVTRHDDVATPIGGEVAPGRRKRGDNACWADVNIIELKMKKIHTIDPTSINGR